MSLALGSTNNAALAASLLASYKAGATNTADAAGPTAAAGSAADTSSAARDTGLDSAVQDFLSYANETPAQRMRDAILKSMGLTEDDLKKMTPDQRKAVEETIEKKIKDAAERAAEQGKKGFVTDVTA